MFDDLAADCHAKQVAVRTERDELVVAQRLFELQIAAEKSGGRQRRTSRKTAVVIRSEGDVARRDGHAVRGDGNEQGDGGGSDSHGRRRCHARAMIPRATANRSGGERVGMSVDSGAAAGRCSPSTATATMMLLKCPVGTPSARR